LRYPSSPVSCVQRRRFSSNPEVRRRLLAMMHPPDTVCEWALRVWRALQEGTSHTMTVWSSPPDISRFESLVNWHHLTQDVCPMTGATTGLNSPWPCQRHMAMSDPHDAIIRPLEDQSRPRT